MADLHVPRGTQNQLDEYVSLLLSESGRQNLIAASTVPAVWERHIADSLQLLDLAPNEQEGLWIDVGSGAGLPGLVVAICSRWRCALVEPRRKRAAFLQTVVDRLQLGSRVSVLPQRIEAVALPPGAVISARAVAGLADLFVMAAHLADERTSWILPKGRSAASEVADARRIWHGRFRMEPSRTDPDATIVVATRVCRADSR